MILENLMTYTPKAVIDKPSDFLYVGDEIELALNHGDTALGIEINTKVIRQL